MAAPTLNVRKTAERLDVSERTVWNLISRGEISHHRVGRQVRLTDTDIDEYLARQRIAAHAQRVARDAPALTPERLDRLAVLLAGAAQNLEAAARAAETELGAA